jgi:4-hydroxy-tetrahydrodipicolinate synthase
MHTTLRGTGVALVTPFNSNFQVDYPALRRLIDHVLDGGVEYLVTLGSTGEAAVLSPAERSEVIRFTLKQAAGRVPVVVGVGGNNTQAVIEELKSLPLAGATAVLSSSPQYNKPSQEGIFEHFKALAAASPLPIILYNVPSRTGSNITAATTIRLAREVKGIVGIKEASGNLGQCLHILRDRPEGFLVVSGDDHQALSLVAHGSEGVISVAANCFPKTFSSLIREGLAGHCVSAAGSLLQLLEGLDLLFVENNPAGVKAFLAEQHIIENVLRLPLVPISEQFVTQIRKFNARLTQL